MNSNIDLKLKLLTDKPGCYLMKQKGEIIYIGKAKNLKNRVKSYFNSTNDKSLKVLAMVSKVDDFDTIVCTSNFEALTLECNLIKQHKPFYNILLKDDKQYPFIKINKKENYTRLLLARKMEKDGAEYFGPYLSTYVVKQVMLELSKVFPLRNCKIKFPVKYKHRPCMQYEIGRCLAPCAQLCTKEEYQDVLMQSIDFLKGKTNDVENILKKNMQESSERMEYEKAASYRDKIKALQQLSLRQSAVQRKDLTQDVWSVACNSKDAMVYSMNVRDGKIIDGRSYFLEGYGKENISEILSMFIPQAYETLEFIPKEIILSENTDDNESLEKWLNIKADKSIKLIIPKRMEKKQLAEICTQNALEALTKKDLYDKLQHRRTIGASESLANILELESIPRRIEAYDISNTQGTFSVASMVVFINGSPAKKAYRKFKIKSVDGPNDFASMQEVLYRRFKHGIEEKEQGISEENNGFADLPDLILIDGGAQQLEFARNSILELGIDVNIFGLAKKNEEIFIPNRNNPIIIDSHDPALHLIQRIRDEAHRFAIDYHRSLRDKSLVKSELLNIDGIGEKRVSTLMKAFKSISSIKIASVDEISKTPGISKDLAKNIFDYFNKKGED